MTSGWALLFTVTKHVPFLSVVDACKADRALSSGPHSYPIPACRHFPHGPTIVCLALITVAHLINLIAPSTGLLEAKELHRLKIASRLMLSRVLSFQYPWLINLLGTASKLKFELSRLVQPFVKDYKY